jgi:hypothetical protein
MWWLRIVGAPVTLVEALAYVDRQDDEERDVLTERLASVILADPILLRSAVTAAWDAGRGSAIAEVCTEHAAELAAIDGRAAADESAAGRS